MKQVKSKVELKNGSKVELITEGESIMEAVMRAKKITKETDTKIKSIWRKNQKHEWIRI